MNQQQASLGSLLNAEISDSSSDLLNQNCSLTRSPGDLYAQKYLRCTALHHSLAFEVMSLIILSPGVKRTTIKLQGNKLTSQEAIT